LQKARQDLLFGHLWLVYRDAAKED
jgi:hypothetical protein